MQDKPNVVVSIIKDINKIDDITGLHQPNDSSDWWVEERDDNVPDYAIPGLVIFHGFHDVHIIFF